MQLGNMYGEDNLTCLKAHCIIQRGSSAGGKPCAVPRTLDPDGARKLPLGGKGVD